MQELFVLFPNASHPEMKFGFKIKCVGCDLTIEFLQ